MHNMLVKYSAWSTAQDLQCPCSHSLVQNEYTIYKVESVSTSAAHTVSNVHAVTFYRSPSACCTSRTQGGITQILPVWHDVAS